MWPPSKLISMRWDPLVKKATSSRQAPLLCRARFAMAELRDRESRWWNSMLELSQFTFPGISSFLRHYTKPSGFNNPFTFSHPPIRLMPQLCAPDGRGLNPLSEGAKKKSFWQGLLPNGLVPNEGILWGKVRRMRGVHGTLNPSLWKWYHRHGYWATRRKEGVMGFETKRKYRYHQVEGLGKAHPKYHGKFNDWWCDKSYYRPLKNWCRF